MASSEPSVPLPPEYTFHNHEIVGAEMADKILRRLGIFRKQDREDVVALVRDHMIDFVKMRRKKLAPVLRARHAALLLQLREADVYGRQPLMLESLQADLDRAKQFYAEDKLLMDLGITPTLIINLDWEKREQNPDPDDDGLPVKGAVLGEKLKIMQNILNSRPRSTRAELLKHVGYVEKPYCHADRDGDCVADHYQNLLEGLKKLS